MENTEKQIIVELNGIKYLVFEIPVVSSNNKKISARVKKYDGIFRGVTKIHNSFWGSSYVIASVLIPEQNVVPFSNDL